MKGMSMKREIVLLIGTAVLSFSFNNARATTPSLKEALQINKMEIIGVPKKGGEITLRLKYTSFIEAEAKLFINFSKLIVPKDRKTDATSQMYDIPLVKGQLYERDFELLVLGDGASLIEVNILLSQKITGYNTGASTSLKVLTDKEHYKISKDQEPLSETIMIIEPQMGNVQPSNKSRQSQP